MHSEEKGWDFLFILFSEVRRQDSVSQDSSVGAWGVQSSSLELTVRDKVSELPTQKLGVQSYMVGVLLLLFS